jgi:dihydrofolate synthase/folylpolyglutamate synthase
MAGRLQLLSLPDFPCPVLLDGAHNPSAAAVLARALRTVFRYRRLHLVFGVLADKDAVGIAAKLLPLADTVWVTQPPSERALPAQRLAELCAPFGKTMQVCPSVKEALMAAAQKAQGDDLICVMGSLYLVGEVLALFAPPP